MMMPNRNTGCLLAVALAVLCGPDAAASETKRDGQDAGAQTDNRTLATQANNPTSLLTQLQIRSVTGRDIEGIDGSGTLTQLQAILPFKPFGWLDAHTTMQLTLPYGNLSAPDGESAFGSFQFFGQAVFKKSWGSLSAGLALSVPNADQRRDGQTWALGPAAGFMITHFDNFVIGALLQNPVAVSPGGGEKASSNLQITPTLSYSLQDGWYVGLSDYSWNVDWKDGDVLLPAGLQVGRVFRIGGRAFSLSIEGGRVLTAPDGDPVPKTLFGIEFTSLHPAL